MTVYINQDEDYVTIREKQAARFSARVDAIVEQELAKLAARQAKFASTVTPIVTAARFGKASRNVYLGGMGQKLKRA